MKIKIHEAVECVFDVGYLVFAIVSAIFFLTSASSNTSVLFLYGIMTLILGIGDTFHLFPRMLVIYKQEKTKYIALLGFGKLITSLTMTVFYVLLFYIWQAYFLIPISDIFVTILYGLVILRIVLCLFPQNDWFGSSNPMPWSILRNLPFLIIGGMIIILYALHAGNSIFQYMPVAVTLSFACYLPVAFYANRYPKIGILMLPKTMMYIWIIAMGFALL